MIAKMDLRGAKVRLLDLAHDLELVDMPAQADALRCLARGPIFMEQEAERPQPPEKCEMGGFSCVALVCTSPRACSYDNKCRRAMTQPTTPNVPRNVPNHDSFGVSKVFTYDNNPAFIER